MAMLMRPARHDDSEALAALKLETFRETFIQGFAIPYPPADLAIFEHNSYGIEQVARELADPEKQTWVVERDGALLGYAHIGPSKLPHPDVTEGAGELYQLYVRNEAQGLGLGKQLLAQALDYLEATRGEPVWLGVWSGNHKAQAIYLANGFKKIGEYQFPVGAWRDDEFIFRRG